MSYQFRVRACALIVFLASLSLLSSALTPYQGRLKPHAQLGTASTAGAAHATPKVLIVGAGLAGTAAARDLIDAGLRDVTVLEARNRPGGRLHSVKTRSGNIDLGAMWVHEAGPSNPLYQLAKNKLNIPVSRTLDYMGGIQAFAVSGQPAEFGLFMSSFIGIQSTVDPKYQEVRKHEQAAIKAGAAPPADRPMSRVFAEYVSENKASWPPGQVEATNALMCIAVQNLLSANITRLSSLRYGDAKTLPATDVHLKPGFDSVVLKLLPGIRVSYNTVVKSINDKGSSVVVTLANGTALTADYVIVTVPLGVLKEGTIKFTPPLPAAKQEAIKNMGMGLMNKVVLVFNKKDVFWDKQADFLLYSAPDWSCKWTGWLSYYSMFKAPVLVSLNSADTALQLESKTDKQVVEQALQTLRRSYGNVPAPVESYVTRWASDPWARGSYSYYAVGNPKNIVDQLAAPHGRILFAGEATSSKMATALGALLSGQREAQRVLQLTKHHVKPQKMFRLVSPK